MRILKKKIPITTSYITDTISLKVMDKTNFKYKLISQEIELPHSTQHQFFGYFFPSKFAYDENDE